MIRFCFGFLLVTLCAAACSNSMSVDEQTSMAAVGWTCEVGVVECNDVGSACHVTSSTKALVCDAGTATGELIFPELTSLIIASGNAIVVEDCDSVTHLRLPKLVTAETSSSGGDTAVVITSNDNLVLVDLSSLKTMGSSAQGLNLQANPKLETFSMAAIESATDLRVMSNSALAAFEVPLLQSTGYFTFQGNPLESVRFDSLQSLGPTNVQSGNRFESSKPLSLTFPSLTSITSNIGLFLGNGVVSLSFPALTTMTVNSVGLFVSGANVLETLDFPVLSTISGTSFSISFAPCPLLKIASFASLTSVSSSIVSNTGAAAFLSFPALSSSTTFAIGDPAATLDVRSLTAASSGSIEVATIITAGSNGACATLNGVSVTTPSPPVCDVSYITSGDCSDLPSICIVEGGGFACNSDASFIYTCSGRSYAQICGDAEFLDGSVIPTQGGLCQVPGATFQCENEPGTVLECALTSKRNPVWNGISISPSE